MMEEIESAICSCHVYVYFFRVEQEETYYFGLCDTIDFSVDVNTSAIYCQCQEELDVNCGANMDAIKCSLSKVERNGNATFLIYFKEDIRCIQ